MKKLSAVAFALLLAVSSGYAYWDYFPVANWGEGEAKVGYDGGTFVKFRFGVMDGLEVFSINRGIHTDYSLGVRYQLAPAFSASLDVGIPTYRGACFGMAPGVQFSTELGVTTLGLGANLNIDLNHPALPNPAEDTEVRMNLDFGLEFDFEISEIAIFWAGSRFNVSNLVGGGDTEFEIYPAVGLVFTAGNLSLGTNIGLNLYATNRRNEDSIGFRGGVDVGLKF